jgi:2,3-bisphosphoglycerate-dependent phosphoglycerate mutase
LGEVIVMAKLVLVRHGQSIWNMENRFTGWVDVPLSKKGVQEAHECAKKVEGFEFGVAYTSVLARAIDTLNIIIEDNGWQQLPVIKDAAINERMYGDLQGLNKEEMREKVGEEQVKLWRRSFDIAPPNGESLKDTAARAVPFFERSIMGDIKQGKDVLVSAHGNSLRAIVMHIEKLNPKQVLELNIPTGVPYTYTFDEESVLIKKEILD